MEAEKDIFLSNTKDKMVQILFLTSRNTYFNSFLKHIEKKCFRTFKHIFLSILPNFRGQQ